MRPLVAIVLTQTLVFFCDLLLSDFDLVQFDLFIIQVPPQQLSLIELLEVFYAELGMLVSSSLEVMIEFLLI
jgi:hypothetical protein